MNLPLVVNPETEADLADAKAWYDRQKAGLSDDLLDRVEETFDLIRRGPRLFGKVFQELRLVRVSRFPYVVIHRIDDDQLTAVVVFSSEMFGELDTAIIQTRLSDLYATAAIL